MIALGVGLGLLSALLFGVGAVAQAHAVRRLATAPERLWGFVGRSVRDPVSMLVVAGYLVGFVLHAIAIWLLPLYLAQATVAMSLPVTAVAATVLHERLRPAHWSAVGVITLGLVLLSAGSGAPGTLVVRSAFAVALWAGVAVLALAGWRGLRLSGAGLGALSGLGYAGSAIAVRGVGTPVEPVILVCAAAVPVYGLLAFWIYSVELDRAPVSSTTAPLIVGETFVPALVGVLLLGDGVRPGWWPAIACGLLLATAGAIALSREGVLRSPDEAGTGSSPGRARRPRRAPRRSRT